MRLDAARKRSPKLDLTEKELLSLQPEMTNRHASSRNWPQQTSLTKTDGGKGDAESDSPYRGAIAGAGATFVGGKDSRANSPADWR